MRQFVDIPRLIYTITLYYVDAVITCAYILEKTFSHQYKGVMMFYTVTKIDEDLDFGCEERQENQPVKAVVSMAGDDGEVITVKMEDALLYERKIEPGAIVYIDTDGLLNKR